MEVAGRFAQDDGNTAIAHDLRVSVRSVQRRHKAWSQGGPGALGLEGAGVVAAAQ
jgi:hypothetical protein